MASSIVKDVGFSNCGVVDVASYHIPKKISKSAGAKFQYPDGRRVKPELANMVLKDEATEWIIKIFDTPSENAQTNATTTAYQNSINMEDLTSPGVFTFGNTFISERDLNNRDLPDCLFQDDEDDDDDCEPFGNLLVDPKLAFNGVDENAKAGFNTESEGENGVISTTSELPANRKRRRSDDFDENVDNEEDATFDQPLKGHIVETKKARDFKDHMRLETNKVVQFELEQPFTGKVAIAIVKRHVEHKNEVVDGLRSTGHRCPFVAYTSNKNDTTYEELDLDGEVCANGAILNMRNEKIINIVFNMFSTETDAEGRKIENAKHWKLMVVPISHQNGGFISQNSMSLRAQQDIQVVTLLRNDNRKKLEKKVNEWIDNRFPIVDDREKSEVFRKLAKYSNAEFKRFAPYDPMVLMRLGLQMMQSQCEN